MKVIIEENDDLVAHGFAPGIYEVGSCDDVVLGIKASFEPVTNLREFKAAPAEIAMKLRIDVEQKPELSFPTVDYQALERKALAPSAREVEEKRLLRQAQKQAKLGQPTGMGAKALLRACDPPKTMAELGGILDALDKIDRGLTQAQFNKLAETVREAREHIDRGRVLGRGVVSTFDRLDGLHHEASAVRKPKPACEVCWGSGFVNGSGPNCTEGCPEPKRKFGLGGM